jgi:Leucine-rich repeat (LRR) protein
MKKIQIKGAKLTILVVTAALLLAMGFSGCEKQPGISAAEVDIPIDVEHFPDANFRTYVAGQWIDQNKDGLLSADEIMAVTRLDLVYSAITSLKGVEYFTALTTLDCYGNQLTDLDIKYNAALTELNCSNNQLTELDISANTWLSGLSCADNQLTDLDVSSCIYLTSLNCANNQLTDLDISYNAALMDLNCSNNLLTDINVTNNAELTMFNCSGNQLNILDVSFNAGLTSLDCCDALLSTLDLSENTALEYLRCFDNQLTDLDISQNTALKELACSWNQLSALDVTHCTRLEYLYCNGNQLRALDVSANTALNLLWCYYNQLGALNVLANTALVSLDCEDNNLTALDVSNNKELTYLSCIENYLPSTAAVRGWQELGLITGYTFQYEPQKGEQNPYPDPELELDPELDPELETEPEMAPVVLESLLVTRLPAKTVYQIGEALNLAGMAVTAVKSDESRQTVTGYRTSPANGTILTTAGERSIMVSYSENGVEKTARFAVTVKPAATPVEPDPPKDDVPPVMVEPTPPVIAETTPPVIAETTPPVNAETTPPVNAETAPPVSEEPAAPEVDTISVRFPGVSGVKVEYNANSAGWKTAGTYGDSCEFTIPKGQKASVRLSKGGMTYSFNSAGAGDTLNVPVKTITVIGIAAACNLAIMQDGTVYDYTSAAVEAPNVFNVFDNNKKYEIRLSKPGFYAVSVPGVAAGQRHFFGPSFFYTIAVPTGVTNLVIHSSSRIVNNGKAGDVIPMLRDNGNERSGKMTFEHNGRPYSVDFKLDGTNPFKGVVM